MTDKFVFKSYLKVNFSPHPQTNFEIIRPRWRKTGQVISQKTQNTLKTNQNKRSAQIQSKSKSNSAPQAIIKPGEPVSKKLIDQNKNNGEFTKSDSSPRTMVSLPCPLTRP